MTTATTTPERGRGTAGSGAAVHALWRRMALVLCTVALIAGGALWVVGADTAARAAWAVGPVVLLVPLTVSTVRSLITRQPGVDVIALLAMVGALAVGEQLAGAIIALMLTGGEALEDAAGRRAERELSALLAAAPRMAHRIIGERIEDVDVAAVTVRDRLVVKPGEVVPVDGVLVDAATLDESTLTGEARPVPRAPGERVSSGVTNIGGSVELIAAATAADSTYAGIIRLVEQARTAKAPFVRMADRYAGWFVPLTLAVAGTAWALSGDPVRALAVLVVATPCPLLLAAPIAIVSGISRAARRGIIIKHGGALESLAGARTICFDKTGTLTTGRPRLADVVPLAGLGIDEVLRLAAAAEQLSPHPFAPALVAAALDRDLVLPVPDRADEQPGEGVIAEVEGRTVTVGTLGLGWSGPPTPEARAALHRASLEGASVAFVCVDGEIAAALHFEDPLRADAARTVRRLRGEGITKTVMVTGDRWPVAELVGSAVGVDRVLAERTPEEKVLAITELTSTERTIMVGDGVNDAPALASADVGVAMGARGATATSETADVVVLVDRLDGVVDALVIARRTRAIAQQSVVVGMGLSLVAMGFAAAGLLAPAVGAVLQEVIDIAVILNALRALTIRTGPTPAPADCDASARFLDAHRTLRPGLARLRHVADHLSVDDPVAVGELKAVQDFLVTELLPHERTEQDVLSDLVRSAHGGEDAVGALHRAHHEIERLTRLLGRIVDAVPLGGPTALDVQELRPVLYGLHTLLGFQLDQEEEIYLTLVSAAGPSHEDAAATV